MDMENKLIAIKKLTESIELISETLFLLKEKRITLEEKMIRFHLHELAENLAIALSLIHKEGYVEKLEIEASTIKNLNELAVAIDEVVTELKKAIEYNWNYLEQYFEHEFYGRLVNEHKFLVKINSIIESIQS